MKEEIHSKKTDPPFTRACLWLPSQSDIRTAIILFLDEVQVVQRNRFRSFMEIVGDDQPVVVEKDGVDEGIDQHFALGLLLDIHAAKAMEEKAKLFLTDAGLGELLAGNFTFEVIPRSFQLIQALLGRAGQKPLFNGA